MLGTIGIKKLRVHCIIGVLPHERTNSQDLIVDIKVRADFSACIKSDCINDTIDYVQIAEIANRLAVEGHYQLIESYAAAVLAILFEKFSITWGWIQIEKPDAIPLAECSVVQLERSR